VVIYALMFLKIRLPSLKPLKIVFKHQKQHLKNSNILSKNVKMALKVINFSHFLTL